MPLIRDQISSPLIPSARDERKIIVGKERNISQHISRKSYLEGLIVIRRAEHCRYESNPDGTARWGEQAEKS